MQESKCIAKLTWPPEVSEIKTIDNSYQPQGNAHLLNVKGFSFYSNPSSEYGGDNNQLNPEDILLTSLTSCFFMTFFSIATKAKLGLSYYECNSELFLGGEKIKFAEKIVLNLKLKCDNSITEEKALDVCQKAHKYCIIANSIKAEIEFNVEIL